MLNPRNAARISKNPLLCQGNAEILKLDKLDNPQGSVNVVKVSLMTIASFFKDTGKSYKEGGKEKRKLVPCKIFVANVTITSKGIGKYRLLFEISEHGKQFNRSSPIFRIFKSCEWFDSSRKMFFGELNVISVVIYVFLEFCRLLCT